MTAAELREAVDRYNRMLELARKVSKRQAALDSEFNPPGTDEEAVMEALVSAVDEVRRAKEAWVGAGRPALC